MFGMKWNRIEEQQAERVKPYPEVSSEVVRTLIASNIRVISIAETKSSYFKESDRFFGLRAELGDY